MIYRDVVHVSHIEWKQAMDQMGRCRCGFRSNNKENTITWSYIADFAHLIFVQIKELATLPSTLSNLQDQNSRLRKYKKIIRSV